MLLNYNELQYKYAKQRKNSYTIRQEITDK